MQSYKYICERDFTPDQICIYPTCKMLKEGTLAALNLSQESASNTTKPRPANSVEKHEEYQLLQEQISQPVQNTSNSLGDFTSRINSLALAKNWKVKSQETVLVSLSSDYVLPVLEIFLDNLLNFNVRVYSWVLTKDHELIQSKFIERLPSHKLCSGIILPDTRKEINFIKHVLSKVIYYFDYKTADLKQPVFQDISEQGTAVYYDHQKITVKFVIKKASNLK